MRVFITTTPDELEPHQHAAFEVARELAHEPVLRDPVARRGLDPVTACGRQVALADAVLAIVGWRRGPVPSATLGGDGLRPWSFWEVKSAFEHRVPVVALLAGEDFAPGLREEIPRARSVVADFRGELARLGAVFRNHGEFRRLARAKLREVENASEGSQTTPADLELQHYPSPELPEQPYPLLLPYTHPDLMAGRDDDLARLLQTLSRPVVVVGLHAASGTGKSSLLAGGLVPILRAERRPVAFERHPAEPGLAARLLADLVVSRDTSATCEVMDPKAFADRLVAVRRLAGGVPPVLVIDQFEDLLKDGAEAARATLGTLLAASAQRLPGSGGPPCRWLLAYRQEFHGRLLRWLDDVLREARTLQLQGIDALPHRLVEPSRFAAWPLGALASPPPAAEDPVAAATRVFLAAIEKPLAGGAFPWAFAPGHAERLARAFAEARVRRPEAPLAPEFQVVLAHLLQQAGGVVGGESVTVRVPEEPGELIDRALEEHLRRALDFAFPRGFGDDASTARTRALLVLRELADVHGRREEGRTVDALARALGEEGREMLQKLATPRTRLVLLKQHDEVGGPGAEGRGPWVYVLAHDRLAEVLVHVVDGGRWAGLGADAELLGLRRFVALQSRLFAAGDEKQATMVSAGYFGRIEEHQEVLLWDDGHRSWWQACQARRRKERRRSVVRRGVAAVVLAVVALLTWTLADRRARRHALLEEVALGKPAAAFVALDRLTAEEGHDPEELLNRLREREKPFDVFESGLGGVGEERRAEVLVRLAELALPILEASPEDPVLIASMVWALDFFVVDPAFAERALALRDEVLGPLRRSRPPPPFPAADDPHWTNIPAGTFWMGSGPEDGRDAPNMQNEKPRHQVTLSAFRMMTHEVANAEYRRLFPDHEGGSDLPAVFVNWYEAYTYAAWLGGRLPTEAEWEYAARASCGSAYCKRDGSEATLSEVAWWVGNSVDPETGDSSAQPVMQLEPNPWGLWDVYGSVWEWNSTWYGPYPEAPQKAPPGPTASSKDRRSTRGGSVQDAKKWMLATGRGAFEPEFGSRILGFRVMIVESEKRSLL